MTASPRQFPKAELAEAAFVSEEESVDSNVDANEESKCVRSLTVSTFAVGVDVDDTDSARSSMMRL
jgi:hypothetical protein